MTSSDPLLQAYQLKHRQPKALAGLRANAD